MNPIRNYSDGKSLEKNLTSAQSEPITNKNSTSNGASAPHTSQSRALFLYTAVAVGLAFFIRFFIAAPYLVSGASMEPTFNDLHYLIIDRVSYEVSEPHRGDVIVFDLPENPSKALIKRVIGLPGETVIVNGTSVRIVNAEHAEGFMLDEPYLDPDNLSGDNNLRLTLEDDQFFVLGDNRRVSADSRIWGALPRENIVGRAFLRLYPFNMMNVLPGEVRYKE